ncbi:ComEA family DNA-binding protein [Myroides sp. DW712]|uniref:ComEA family DNA-binding protein n=1 Tax=Myroides sp. DW712 TaxID=3389800 RepID=UPI003978967E
MKWKNNFYHWYYYTQSQKRGFIALILVVCVVQGLLYLCYYRYPDTRKEYTLTSEEQKFIQRELDSLRILATRKKDTIYPFNPNYLTDYKGFMLELSMEALDRLFAYREAKRYVNSTQAFQEVTGVSEAWMQKYGRFMVFSSRSTPYRQQNKDLNRPPSVKAREVKSKPIQDINTATVEGLQGIYGIGPTLSQRILDDRDKWGGYVHIDQLKFVYGLSDAVIITLLQHYAVLSPPSVQLLDLNQATVDDLKNIPYLNYYLAREIVKYRSLHGDFVNKEQLREIEKIPLDKIHIISLYLEIRN